MHALPRCTVIGLVGFMAELPTLAATPPSLRINPARVDAVFKDYNSPSSPGCALGIYQDGKVLYSWDSGMADLNQATPITPRRCSTSALSPNSSRPRASCCWRTRGNSR